MRADLLAEGDLGRLAMLCGRLDGLARDIDRLDHERAEQLRADSAWLFAIVLRLRGETGVRRG